MPLCCQRQRQRWRAVVCALLRGQEIIRCQGLEPLDFDFVVLKSAVHFRGDFTAVASHIVEVTGPGIHSSRLSDFDFKQVRRPIWPLDGHFDQPEPGSAPAAASRL